MPWKFACIVLLVTVLIYLVACSNSKVSDPARWISNNISAPAYWVRDRVNGIVAISEEENGQNLTMSGGTSTANSVNVIQGLEHESPTEVTDAGDVTLGGTQVYDPVQQGALSAEEVESHYQHQAEMSPFATVGAQKRVERTDDPYARTGVPWVFRPPCRTHATIVSGPQAGARQAPSDSSKDIMALHRKGKCAEYTW
jgi:hypothetical protein